MFLYTRICIASSASDVGHMNSPEFPLARQEMVHAIVQGILRGAPCNSVHVVKLDQGWAQKPPPTKPCTKEVALKRAKWIEMFYATAVSQHVRANEYTAEVQVKVDHPDEEEMWMDSSALKSHFGKLTKARKLLKEASKVQSDSATVNQASIEDAGKHAAAASAEFLAAIELDEVDPLSDCTVDIDEINFMLEEVGLWSLEDK